VEIQITGEHQIRIAHIHGIGMVPKISRPEVGEGSAGYRIIRSRLIDNLYEVVLEGKSGSRSDFEFRIFDQKIEQINGGKIIEELPGGIVKFQVDFPRSKEPFIRKKITLKLI
jgi:hypothetical protein